MTIMMGKGQDVVKKLLFLVGCAHFIWYQTLTLDPILDGDINMSENRDLTLWDTAPLQSFGARLAQDGLYPQTWAKAKVGLKWDSSATHSSSAIKNRIEAAIVILERGIAVSLGLNVLNQEQFQDLSCGEQLAFRLMVCGSPYDLLTRPFEQIALASRDFLLAERGLDTNLERKVAYYDNCRKQLDERMFTEDEVAIMQAKLQTVGRTVSSQMHWPLLQLMGAGSVAAYVASLESQMYPTGPRGEDIFLGSYERDGGRVTGARAGSQRTAHL